MSFIAISNGQRLTLIWFQDRYYSFWGSPSRKIPTKPSFFMYSWYLVVNLSTSLSSMMNIEQFKLIAPVMRTLKNYKHVFSTCPLCQPYILCNSHPHFQADVS